MRSNLVLYKTAPIHPGIRRLWEADQPQLIQHFQRLDPQSLRLRFGSVVSPSFVDEYARQVLSIDSVIFGAFPDGELRGVAELRGLLDSRHRSAEVALLVEPQWRDRGIGDALFTRLFAAAQNRGIRILIMFCLRENTTMRNLAQRHNATLEVDLGEVEATLAPPWPTPMSVFQEMFGDTRTYLEALYQLPK